MVVLFIPFLFHERVVDGERADKQLAGEIWHLTGRNEVGITLLFCPSFSLPFKENRQSAIHEREGSKGQRRLRAKNSAQWITLRRGNSRWAIPNGKKLVLLRKSQRPTGAGHCGLSGSLWLAGGPAAL